MSPLNLLLPHFPGSIIHAVTPCDPTVASQTSLLTLIISLVIKHRLYVGFWGVGRQTKAPVIKFYFNLHLTHAKLFC